MKKTTSLFTALITCIVVLILVNGCLLQQNISYKNENRELILENDSILSVNLTLSKSNHTTQARH